MKKAVWVAVCLMGVGLLAGCPSAKRGVTFSYTPVVVNQSGLSDAKVAVNIEEEGQFPMERKADGSYETTLELDGSVCEYFFFVNDEAIGDMRNFEGQFSPEADYYVDDGFGGFNALRVLKKDEAVRKIQFVYKPVDDDWSQCEDDNMEVEVWINNMDYFKMDYDENEEVFKKTVDVRGNCFEFYFSICGYPVPDMRTRSGNFQPAVKYYSADSFGGYNALYVNE